MLKFIFPSSSKDKNFELIQKSYLEKIGHYYKYQVIYLEEYVYKSVKENIEINSDLILKKIKDDDVLIVLDLHGISFDSIKMAKKFESYLASSNKDLVFVIGASDGISQNLRKRANFLWKFSDLTFTNHLCRILLLEQVYRFITINHNITYHK